MVCNGTEWNKTRTSGQEVETRIGEEAAQNKKGREGGVEWGKGEEAKPN